MPKQDRFAIGQKIENLLLDILVTITTVYHTKNEIRKRELLGNASTALESVKILIRLAKDTQALTQEWYIKCETHLREIGKMIGGWMASLNK